MSRARVWKSSLSLSLLSDLNRHGVKNETRTLCLFFPPEAATSSAADRSSVTPFDVSIPPAEEEKTDFPVPSVTFSSTNRPREPSIFAPQPISPMSENA